MNAHPNGHVQHDVQDAALVRRKPHEHCPQFATETSFAEGKGRVVKGGQVVPTSDFFDYERIFEHDHRQSYYDHVNADGHVPQVEDGLNSANNAR